MIDFPEEYFQKEIRDGFEIESMMKRAWAGQMEVLQEIRAVCERHNIKWFADYGTLLGAVRHKGYIPWDDDMDIGMKRDALNAFIRYGKDELPDGYKILCMDLVPEYDSLIVRVVNSTDISTDADRMKKYHGCPYVLGIDIFPLDYLSRNPEECQLHMQLYDIVLGAVDTVSNGEMEPKELEEYLTGVEELTNVKINRTRPLRQELTALAEKIGSIFTAADSDEVAGLWRLVYQKNFHFPKEWFDDLIEVPFENITIPIPREYDNVLRLKMGDNYMTPIKSITHDYPFYKRQEDIIFEQYGFRPQ